MASFEVRVVNENQEGLSGIRIKLKFEDFTRGMSTEEYTNSEGSAFFDNYDEGDITVYIDGDDRGSYYYEKGGCITITK